VIAAAAILWGHSLTEEREARLGDSDTNGPVPSAAALMRQLTVALTERISEAAAEAARVEAARAADAAAPTGEQVQASTTDKDDEGSQDGDGSEGGDALEPSDTAEPAGAQEPVSAG
jgi:hypothetical protein